MTANPDASRRVTVDRREARDTSNARRFHAFALACHIGGRCRRTPRPKPSCRPPHVIDSIRTLTREVFRSGGWGGGRFPPPSSTRSETFARRVTITSACTAHRRDPERSSTVWRGNITSTAKSRLCRFHPFGCEACREPAELDGHSMCDVLAASLPSRSCGRAACVPAALINCATGIAAATCWARSHALPRYFAIALIRDLPGAHRRTEHYGWSRGRVLVMRDPPGAVAQLWRRARPGNFPASRTTPDSRCSCAISRDQNECLVENRSSVHQQ